MGNSRMTALLRGALCIGLASCTLFAAEVATSPAPPDSGAGGLYPLVLGIYAALFGGMVSCYGLVRLVEMAVQRLKAHPAPSSVPQIRHPA
jgi:hypothetical protein